MALEMTLKRSKKPVYPTKTTINLAVDDKGENKLARNLVLFAVALVLIALFAKFAVVDVISHAAGITGTGADNGDVTGKLQRDKSVVA